MWPDADVTVNGWNNTRKRTEVGWEEVPNQPSTLNINIFTQQMCCAHFHHLKKGACKQQDYFRIIPLSPHTVELGFPYQNNVAASRSTGRPAGTFGLCCRWWCADWCSCSGWLSQPSDGHLRSGHRGARWGGRKAPLFSRITKKYNMKLGKLL